MKITAIEPQKKKHREDRKRYNLYIDGEFVFGLYEETILKADLHVNKVLDNSQIDKIRKDDEYEYAKRAAFDYLSYRVRSESEIKKKLKLKKITSSTIEEVIVLLRKLNMLNDEEFSRQLVNDKVNRRPVGKRVLKQKLFEKGIDKETSDKVLDEFFQNTDETELAELALKKYLPKVRNDDYMAARKKCFDYLVRKGFDYDIINEIIQKYIN